MAVKKSEVIPYARWVVITGCDSGFGFHTCCALAARGFGIIAACLTPHGQSQLREAVGNNPRVEVIVCDITHPEMVNQFEEQIRAICPDQLWGLVNNAGITIPGYTDYLTLEEYRKVMEVNFFAAVNLTLRLLPLIKHTRGRIVNIGSTCGLVALPGNAPYNASKFAIRGFTDTLRRELKVWGVNVVLIEPGVMKTSISTEYCSLMQSRYAEASTQIHDSYGKTFTDQLISHYTKKIDAFSQDPQKTVKTICHAICDHHPRPLYLPGIDARYFFFPLSKSPTWVVDPIVQTNGGKKPTDVRHRGKITYEFSEIYSAPLELTWNSWLQSLWKEGAGFSIPMKIEEVGDAHGTGCTRFIYIIGHHGIREGITETDYPHWIRYIVKNPSWFTFPVSFHRGEIRFIPIQTQETAIVWTIEVTPKLGAKLIVRSFLKFIIPRYLAYLTHVLAKIC